MENLMKITPNKEKAKSILKMVETTIDMIDTINIDKFPSNITKEYYEVIRELLTVVLLLDGYKTYGEGAHKRLIEYVENNYKEFSKYEIYLIDNLRNIRNKIAYDGFFVDKDYIERKKKDIENIIRMLKEIIKRKLDQK
jgi:hypothetical protein